MKVINPNATSYSFKYIPREYNLEDVSYTLVREYGDYEVTLTGLTPTNDNLGYRIINLDLSAVNMIEGDGFTIVINDSTKVLYRSKIYVTTQTNLQDFEI
jgi:hypothetical protein